MEEPGKVRINKYLAEKGYATRRGADALIESKKVKINGRTAVLGDKVSAGDSVEVLGHSKKVPYVYLAYHKPAGVVANATMRGEKDIASVLKGVSFTDLFPIGRLDKSSAGLVILTNDGRITDRILNPKYEHRRTYLVEMDKKLTPRFKAILERGMDIENERTKPCTVELVGDARARITLTESKKHQIRRMCAALGYTPTTITRVGLLNIALGNLKPNEYRAIEGSELATFLATLKL